VESVVWLTAVRAAAIVIAFIAFTWALRRMRRESAEHFGRLHIAQQQARAEMHALSERITALATLVAALAARGIERPPEAPAPPRPRREASPVRSYETAHRLARSGATVEEIMATCGVAGSEARLLRRLHAGPTARENVA
jgi:hypothetical protein